MTQKDPIPSITTHAGLLLYVLAQNKRPLRHIDLVRQVFPFWAALTRRTDEWLALSKENKREAIRERSSLVKRTLDAFSSLIIREVQPNTDTFIGLNPKYRPAVDAFVGPFWGVIKPFLSMDDIRKVQAELERVYPSKRKLAPIPL